MIQARQSRAPRNGRTCTLLCRAKNRSTAALRSEDNHGMRVSSPAPHDGRCQSRSDPRQRVSRSCPNDRLSSGLRLDRPQSPLAHDFERYDTRIATFVRPAMIRIMLPRWPGPPRYKSMPPVELRSLKFRMRTFASLETVHRGRPLEK